MRLVALHVLASASIITFAMTIGPRPSPTSSWWLDNLPPATIPAAATKPPTATDVAIIGAGMTGCSVAYWLKQLFSKDGEHVTVLDARGCAGGATGRNGGHLWHNPSSDFECKTVEELLKFVKDVDVDCDLTRRGGAAFERAKPETGVTYYDAAGDPEEAFANQWEEDDALKQWDATECEKRVQTTAFSGAAVYPLASSFYPAKITAALLEAAACTYCAPVRVLSISTSSDGTCQEIRWSQDPTDHSDSVEGGGGGSEGTGVLRSKHVVVATNGWAGELLPELASHIYPTRNQVIMTAPLPATAEWQVGGFSVDSEVGARELYGIRRPDGRLCFGGARALEPGAAVGSNDDTSTSEVLGAYLRRFLAEAFPHAIGADGEAGEEALSVEAEWTGVLGFTQDGRPLVGRVPGRPNVFVAAGFNGHGMPQCFGVGKGIAQMIEEKDQEGAPAPVRDHAPEDLHPFLRPGGETDPARFLQGP